MNRRAFLGSALTLPFAANLSLADEKSDMAAVTEKALVWLSKQQRNDGSFEVAGGQNPTAMTGLAGMAFLMEGSTIKEGKYSSQIKKATEWYMKRSQANGLLGNPSSPMEAGRYMYGHGFGLMFLACVYGEEEDEKRRKELEKVITKAVEFSGKAQTDRGGWGYVSATEGGGFDEGSVTITQLQGIRAARNAGIVVPKSIIDKSIDYLKKSTTPDGGVIYSLAHGGAAVGAGRPALTAAAVACSFAQGEYKSDLAKKWLKYCQKNIRFGQFGGGHDHYQTYYFAQAVYVLGDDGWEKIFNEKNGIKWSEFKKPLFASIAKEQNAEGGFNGGSSWGAGSVFTASVYLMILQLENNTLPIYMR